MSLLFAKKSPKVYVFIGYVVNVILWVLCSFLMKMDIEPSPVFWNKLCVTFTFLTPIFIYCYLTVYTKCFNWKKTLFLSIGIVACLIINWSGLLVVDCHSERDAANRIIGWYYQFDFRFAVAVFAYYFFTIIVLIAKGFFLIRTKKVTFGQIDGFMIGTFIMFIGYAFNIIPGIGKYPLDIAATLITSVLLFVSLYRKKLFEFKIIVSQGTALFCILTVVLGSCALIMQVLLTYLESHYPNEKNYVLVGTTIAMAILMQPLIIGIKKFLNKYMNKYANNQNISLNKFRTSISNNLDIESVSDELLTTINESLHTPKSCLMLYNKNRNVFSIYKSSSILERMDFELSYNNPLINLFLKRDNYIFNVNEVNMIPELKSMWDKEKKELYHFGIELIVPLKSRKQIIGLLLLMSKENKRRFNTFDYDNLKSLAFMTGVAIDNANMFQEAQREAYIDSQTSLFNHKYFMYTLTKMLNTEKNKYRTLSLLMIDLDNFKLYNELYGFKGGDDAIIHCAEIMTETLKEQGSLYRYSGQEFAIIIPNSDITDALRIAEEIRTNIEKGFVTYKKEVNISGVMTASIGVCHYPINAIDDSEILKNSLFALYVAKNSGKNKVSNYSREIKDAHHKDEIFNQDESIMMKNRATIYALTAAIDTKDHFTFAHSQNVAYYTVEMAKALNLDTNTILLFEEAALLHDIGKIGIAESILSKTGRLTDEEYAIIKTHVELCVTTIKFLPSTNHVIPLIYSHHERFDGRGYPRGLAGHEIPLGGRVLAIADAFDAMVSQRAYKKAMPVEYAIGELEKNMNKQFDGELAKLFIQLVKNNKIEVRIFTSDILETVTDEEK